MTHTNTLQAQTEIRDGAAPSPPSRAGGVPLPVLAVTAVLFFLRYGYDYSTGDQDEILPFLLHRLDPSLFARDWMVQTLDASFSVRDYSVLVLQGLASVFPVWLAVLMVYLASWTALAVGVYKVAEELLGDKIAASAALVGTLVMTRLWTLGSNDFASGTLTPTEMASACAVWGLFFFLRRRFVVAGIILGAATCFQALVGLHMAGVLGLTLLPDLLRRHRRPAVVHVIRFGLAYLVAGAAALGPILYQQIISSSSAEVDAARLYYILAEFRLPHHYLFFSFAPSSFVKFGVLALIGMGTLAWIHRKGRLRHAWVVWRMLIATAALLVVSVLFTEVWPSLFVAKLQLFKLTVPLKLLFVAGICGFLAAQVPPRLYHRIAPLTENTRWTVGLSLVLLVGFTLIGREEVFERIGPLARKESPLAQVEDWARTRTARDALFAIPPSNTTFRSHARRAVVVNFKSFPFEDRQMPVWLDRLTDVSPIALPERGGYHVLARLDSAYHAQSAHAWQRLAGTYGIDYVVRKGPLHTEEYTLELVHRVKDWFVYRIGRPQPALSSSSDH